MSITLTETAAKEVQRLIEKQSTERTGNGAKASDMYLRVSAKSGGCSGMNYHLEVTAERTDFDETSVQHGVNVICDSSSLNYLNGTIVDFKDGLRERGFSFENPQANKSCSCGSSFSA